MYAFALTPSLNLRAYVLYGLPPYGISGHISSFLSNRQLRVVMDGKFSQEYPVNDRVSQGSILGRTLFPLYINDRPDDVIGNTAI